MTRDEILNISIGQTGLYPWSPALPVIRVDVPYEGLVGRNKGKVFRTIEVGGEGRASIAFIVRED